MQVNRERWKYWSTAFKITLRHFLNYPLSFFFFFLWARKRIVNITYSKPKKFALKHQYESKYFMNSWQHRKYSCENVRSDNPTYLMLLSSRCDPSGPSYDIMLSSWSMPIRAVSWALRGGAGRTSTSLSESLPLSDRCMAAKTHNISEMWKRHSLQCWALRRQQSVLITS